MSYAPSTRIFHDIIRKNWLDQPGMSMGAKVLVYHLLVYANTVGCTKIDLNNAAEELGISRRQLLVFLADLDKHTENFAWYPKSQFVLIFDFLKMYPISVHRPGSVQAAIRATLEIRPDNPVWMPFLEELRRNYAGLPMDSQVVVEKLHLP